MGEIIKKKRKEKNMNIGKEGGYWIEIHAVKIPFRLLPFSFIPIFTKHTHNQTNAFPYLWPSAIAAAGRRTSRLPPSNFHPTHLPKTQSRFHFYPHAPLWEEVRFSASSNLSISCCLSMAD